MSTSLRVTQRRPIEGARTYSRSPVMKDWQEWRHLRASSRSFLERWEPLWRDEQLSRGAFRRMVRYDKKSDSQCRLLIFRRSDDKMLGSITLTNIRRGNCQSASLGYWIGEPFARQGYMTDALSATVDHAFRTMRLHRLEAGCLPSNTASRSLLEKVGFREEGYARGYLQINGKWEDHIMFGLLSGDPRRTVQA